MDAQEAYLGFMVVEEDIAVDDKDIIVQGRRKCEGTASEGS